MFCTKQFFINSLKIKKMKNLQSQIIKNRMKIKILNYLQIALISIIFSSFFLIYLIQ